VDRWQEIHNVNAGPCRIKLATRMEAVPVPLARPVGGGHFCLPGPNGPPTGPKGQPFPQPGPKALEGIPTTSRQAQRADRSAIRGLKRRMVGPLGRQTWFWGRFMAQLADPTRYPARWAGLGECPARWACKSLSRGAPPAVVAFRSTSRCCRPVRPPLRCRPVHIPIGPLGRVSAVRACPAPTGRRPAQRASHSPSQGRRPWRWTSIGNHEVSSAKALWSPQRDQYSPIDQPTTQERHGSVVAQTRCGEDHPGHRPCRLVSNWLVGALKATPPRSIASA
jgi:hypothetical protein